MKISRKWFLEQFAKNINKKHTKDGKSVDQFLECDKFSGLNGKRVHEVGATVRRVEIKRSYQHGAAVDQLAKLRMLEFLFDFIDRDVMYR